MATTVNLSDPNALGRQSPYPLAIAFGFISLSVALLLIPPFISHYKNRNIGATVLVLNAIIMDLCIFLNAIIWSSDDIDSWYTGIGYCDIQIKVFVVQLVMFLAACAMVLRGLANVMDTNSTNWSASAAKKRRNTIIDLVCCVLVPMLQMPLQWITQPLRYYIFGIAGCIAPTDGSWLYILLTLGPSFIWSAICVYYSVLLLIRLIRYRRAFNAILAASSTTKSRFLRLYLLSTSCVLGLIPAQIYILVDSIHQGVEPFSWSAAHNPAEYAWDSVIMVPSNGKMFFDRYIWIVGSVLIFAFFGFGRDACKTYREVLVGVGMGRVIPSLRAGYERERRDTAGSVGTFSTIGSKARLFLSKRKQSGSVTTSATDSMRSPTLVSSNDSYSTSPRKTTFQSMDEKMSYSSSDKHSGGGFWTSLFNKTKARKTSNSRDPFVMATYNRQAMIQSNISAEPHSPATLDGHQQGREDVVVRTEVRQGSETVEPVVLQKTMYEGV